MSGGGSQGTGLVDYCLDLKTRWASNHDIMSDQVGSAEPSPPDHVSDGINPYEWYGSFGSRGASFTPAQALLDFTDTDPFTYWRILIAEDQMPGDTGQIRQLREWLEKVYYQVLDETGAQNTISAMVTSHANDLLMRIRSDVLPKLEVGARNVNAVLSTALMMAKASIFDTYDTEISGYRAKLEMDLLTRRHSFLETLTKLEPLMWNQTTQIYEQATQRVQQYLDHVQTRMATTMSLTDSWWEKYSKFRMIQTEDQIRDTTWGLEMHEYMLKSLASISGAGTLKNDRTGINAAASALSGAATGAVAGAMIGSKTGHPYGIAIGAVAGAVVGGVGGYLASQ